MKPQSEPPALGFSIRTAMRVTGHADTKAVFLAVALVFLAAPACALPLMGNDLLTAAGLTPTSTIADARRLYGAGRPMGPSGVEFLNQGSSDDA